MRLLPALLLTVACASDQPTAPPPARVTADAAAPRADAAATPVDAAPAPVDAAPAAVDQSAARIVLARFVSGDPHFFACGTLAFVGVYVYEVIEIADGPPLTGRFVVDMLCPDMMLGKGVKLTPGQLHRLTLGPAHGSYAGMTTPASPDPTLPRFQVTKIEPT